MSRQAIFSGTLAILITPTLFLFSGCAISNDHKPVTGPNRAEILPAAVNPYKAYLWRRQIWQDENGNINPDLYRQALKQRQMNIAHSANSAGKDAGLNNAAWTERGPRNVGGRTRSILIHPNTNNKLWIGSVSGGVWHSESSGNDWTLTNDWWDSLAIGCMAMDPQNPDVMYAGTGEGFFNGDAIGGAGIFKTTDGGQTWEQLPSTADWDNVCRIAISPTNSNLIIAAKRYGGFMRSTDGGQTWTNPYWAQGGFYVEFHPTDGNKAVATVIDYDWTEDNWFHRTLYTTDGGETWNPVSGGLNKVWGFGSRIELAYARSNPDIVYASCAADGGKIWKSTDGGQSYTQQPSSYNTGVSWYACPLWVDPTNPDILVTGGVHLHRSMDGGITFTQISSGYIMTEQVHPDMHLVVSSPRYDGINNRTVYACSDGGVHVTYDIYTVSTDSGWFALDEGYRTTQFYGAAGDGNSDMLLGGTQDNGTQRVIADDQNAHMTFGGDGGFCAIDWTDPDYCYGEYINLEIHRSTNGGQSAGYIYDGIADAGNSANFIAPFILDPNNPNTMLAGGRSLWRTDNVKDSHPTWRAIRDPGDSNISAIAVAPGNPDIIYVGQNDGKVARTLNGTAADPTWTYIDDNTLGSHDPFPDRYITRIVIDPNDYHIVYVTLGGFASDNLWRTENAEQTLPTWNVITGSGASALPAAPIKGVAIHPDHPDWLYVGTQVGVFASEDGGQTWSTRDDGPSAVSVDEITFMHDSRTLLVATHGRGMFTIDLSDSCPEDLNGDGLINQSDLGILLAAYEINSGGDIDGDGDTDQSDLGRLLAMYNFTCP